MAAYLTRFYNSVMKKLLLVLCGSLVLILAPLYGETHEWTNTQGKTIKAEFVSATNESVTISMQGKIFVVKLADLSPQSRALAEKLRAPNAVGNQALNAIGLALPKPMKSRCDPEARIRRLREGGGKAVTEEVIVRGLDWLKATQAKDGSWGANDKDAQGQLKPSDKNAMTAMALLCFLGHCELQDSPKYGNTVHKAIEFLTSTPPEDPGIAQGNRGCYSHPIRTYGLCEAFTMTKIKTLEPFAKRAAAAVIKGQNESGGWAYGYVKGPTAHIDLSVTSWNIKALKAAALTGILIEGLDVAMDKAVAYVKRCQDSDGRFKYREERHGGHSVNGSLTGAGVLSLQLWKNGKSEEATKGLEWIINNLKNEKEWSKVNVYAWYYHAQACFQATSFSSGRKYWKAWNENFEKIVLGAQASDGHWPPGADFHGNSDVFRTTLTILMLEVYYRFAPMGGGLPH